MYTIIVKYYSYKDKEIHIEEFNGLSIEETLERFKHYSTYDGIVLSASYKDECAVIKQSISEE